MIELIIIGVVIYIIYKKRKDNIDTDAGRGVGRAGDRVQTTTAPMHRMKKPEQKPIPSVPQSTVFSGTAAASSGSTTEYLNEKARMDAVEHAREDREEEMRLNKAYGGLRVAERLYEGDNVPQGRRLCVCGYCGAENLIPTMARERFCCYFCREPLT